MDESLREEQQQHINPQAGYIVYRQEYSGRRTLKYIHTRWYSK